MLTLDVGPLALGVSHVLLFGSLLLATLVGWLIGRRHGCNPESQLFRMLMLGLLELSGTPAGVLWGCGALLLSARLLHALGLGGSAGYSAGRFTGALLTFVVLLAMALAGLWRFFAPLAM